MNRDDQLVTIEDGAAYLSCTPAVGEEVDSALGEGRALAKGSAGKDAIRLDGYTWHSNRHTFASRLVMAGVDLRTVQELGGWKTLSMVERYSHLAPSHLQAAVDRLVPQSVTELARN